MLGKRFLLEWHIHEMKRALKALLLWLLLATLPLQGYTAVARTSCGLMASQHLPKGMTTSQSSHREGDGDASPVSVTTTKSNGNLAGAKHKSGSCSACATCWVGAGAPPPIFASPPITSHSWFAASPSSPLPNEFIPAGPERPPRRLTSSQTH